MMENQNKDMIEILTKMVERSDRWIEDATERTDWNDVSYYQGKRNQANEIIVMLGGKWIV